MARPNIVPPTNLRPFSTGRKRSRAARTIATLLLAVIFAWFFSLGVMSAGYVYHLIHPPCPPVPANLPPEIEEVEFASRGGYALRGWWHPPTHGAAIILLGGHGANRSSMRNEFEILARAGYGVLSLDGRSCDGQIATLGYREVDDLAGAVDFVRSVDPSARIGVLGFSVGGITAIRGAAQIDSLRAVVAEGGFSSLDHEITRGDSTPLSLTWTIQRWTLFFYTLMTGVFPGQVNPAGEIGRISPRPVLLIYGEKEIPAGDARIQYAAAGEPRELWVVPGAGHGGYLQAQPDEYPARIVAFFDRWLVKNGSGQ